MLCGHAQAQVDPQAPAELRLAPLTSELKTTAGGARQGRLPAPAEPLAPGLRHVELCGLSIQ